MWRHSVIEVVAVADGDGGGVAAILDSRERVGLRTTVVAMCGEKNEFVGLATSICLRLRWRQEAE